MDFEVDFGVIKQAGSRAKLIAQDAMPGLSAMRVESLSSAIPGGASGAVADRLDQAWVKAAKEIAGDLDFYAGALTSTADNYRSAEEAAAKAAESFFGGLQ